MKIEQRDPWRDWRDRENTFIATAPRTRATLALRPATAIGVAWALFWHALLAFIRRRDVITFWMEDGS